MKPRDQQRPHFPYFVVALLLFFGAYMGLYYGLLQRKAAPGALAPGPVLQNRRFVPSYHHHNQFLAVAFYPANCVDRLLRPAYWKELRGWDELAPPS